MATNTISIELTDAAAKMLRAAQQESGGSAVIRFSADPEFRHRVEIGLVEPGDVIASSHGLAIHVAADSARRVAGSRLDFIPGRDGGIRIDNPNEPPRVRVMRSFELKHRLSTGEKLELLDVRGPDEREKAKIEGARALDLAALPYVDSLPKDTMLVFYCHWGNRAQKTATQYLLKGFRRVHNLAGGIDEWSLTVDPSVPRY